MINQENGNKRVTHSQDFPAPDFASPDKGQINGHMPTRFIRRKEVCHLTGLSPSSVYLLMNQNKFPASIRLPGGKAVAWLLSDVQEWQRQCIAAASQPASDAA